jgi:hypothetical protein
MARRGAGCLAKKPSIGAPKSVRRAAMLARAGFFPPETLRFFWRVFPAVPGLGAPRLFGFLEVFTPA